MPHVQFEGAGVAVPLDVPFRKVILPASQILQRPGDRMTPQMYIQHETANTKPGANAAMHLDYLQRGAPDDNGVKQQLGYHLTVDRHECIQMIPLNEITWHGGDGAGQCNMRGIACELTVEDDNRFKVEARRNAEQVAAAVMLAMNLTRLEQHNFCSGKECPHFIRAEGYWPTFTANVRARLSGEGSAPEFTDLPQWLPEAALRAAFPLANPQGSVTRAVIAWASETGKTPWFIEKIDIGATRNVWRFEGVTFFSEGEEVWREGQPS